jgi:hypothetical protein
MLTRREFTTRSAGWLAWLTAWGAGWGMARPVDEPLIRWSDERATPIDDIRRTIVALDMSPRPDASLVVVIRENPDGTLDVIDDAPIEPDGTAKLRLAGCEPGDRLVFSYDWPPNEGVIEISKS